MLRDLHAARAVRMPHSARLLTFLTHRLLEVRGTPMAHHWAWVRYRALGVLEHAVYPEQAAAKMLTILTKSRHLERAA